MKTRLQFHLLLLLTLCLLVSGVVGCKPQRSSPSEYVRAYSALLTQYDAQMEKVIVPTSQTRSMTRAQKLASVIQSLENGAAATQDFANKLRQLKPPLECQDIHSALLSYFDLVVENSHKLAEAFRNGNRETLNRVAQEMNASEAGAQEGLILALKRAGGKSKEIQSIADEFKQSLRKR